MHLQFRATIEPFLRQVKGRRGVVDFQVVCDETNNPQSVVDANQFRLYSLNLIEVSTSLH